MTGGSTGSGSGVVSGSPSSGQSGSGPTPAPPSTGAGSSGTPSPCVAGTSGATGSDEAPTGAGPTDASPRVTIGFNDIPADFAQPYTESGFTVSPTSVGWGSSTGYGNPAPFIEFISSAAGAVAGTIQVTEGGAAFGFESVDLYSSVTPIPYTFVGLRNCSTVFMETNIVPNTYGNFQTVLGQHPTSLIDTLTITLTNPAIPGGNPMGLDNIVLIP
jgi:hypothetical protein